MNRIQNISLEFLRPGSPHNQLLSPLTDYLALCGNHGAKVVNVPYQHETFLRKIRELRSSTEENIDQRSRQAVIEETAQEICEMLSSIPGLISGLANLCDERTLIHLKIVLTANELAMIPFELTKVIPGMPGGSNNWLSLQIEAPVCITRQIRNISGDKVEWPIKPRILFVASAPNGLKIPIEQHTQALLSAIQPWLKKINRNKKGEFLNEIGKLLTILPNADIQDVESICSNNDFTHVHVLAHGMEDEKTPGKPFGLAFKSHINSNGIDVVSGSRFSTAIRSLNNKNGPTIVTIASCDSGNMKGSEIHNTASFVHELHQAGIPFVVGSQFPLSFSGSIHLTEVLYGHLLWGEDPRLTLHKVRRRLYTLQSSYTHDWASLIVYAALPEDLESQLGYIKYQRAREAINAAMDHVDKAIKEGDNKSNDSNSEEESITAEEITGLLDRVDRAIEKIPIEGEYYTEGLALRASAEKRKAEACFRATERRLDRGQEYWLKKCLNLLISSKKYYEKAIRESIGYHKDNLNKRVFLHWVLTQSITLDAILGNNFNIDFWHSAKLAAEVDIESQKPNTAVWGHSSLAELYLVIFAFPKNITSVSDEEAREKALMNVQKMVDLSIDDTFPIYSTRKQFKRYYKWWWHEDFKYILQKMKKKPHYRDSIMQVAETLVNHLPKIDKSNF